LVHFADNEGIIGPKTSKKLSGDFRHYATALLLLSKNWNHGDWWGEKYREWIKAFEWASDGGFVEFH
jgi:hypothetical protein